MKDKFEEMLISKIEYQKQRLMEKLHWVETKAQSINNNPTLEHLNSLGEFQQSAQDVDRETIVLCTLQEILGKYQATK